MSKQLKNNKQTEAITDHNKEESDTELNLVKSKSLRLLLLFCGHISLFMAFLGILPIIPVTPFVLLAAACYSLSSPKFYGWLLNHKHFGPLIRNWRADRSIHIKHKILAITTIIVFSSFSIYFAPIIYVKIGVAVIVSLVIVYLLSLKTKYGDIQ